MSKHSAKKYEKNARKYVLDILTSNFRNLQSYPGENIHLGNIAKELNVSRTPVHEAFASLERQKLLVTTSRKSILVSPINTTRIHESIWMHQTTTIGLLEEIYPFSFKAKQLEKLSHILSTLDITIKEKSISELPKLRDAYFFALYELASLTSVYNFLEFGTADLQRLLCLEKSIDIWSTLISFYHEIYQGLNEHNYDLAKNAVLKECAKISHILLIAQQNYIELFEK